MVLGGARAPAGPPLSPPLLLEAVNFSITSHAILWCSCAVNFFLDVPWIQPSNSFVFFFFFFWWGFKNPNSRPEYNWACFGHLTEDVRAGPTFLLEGYEYKTQRVGQHKDFFFVKLNMTKETHTQFVDLIVGEEIWCIWPPVHLLLLELRKFQNYGLLYLENL
jgi:hypothetical protein